MENRGFQNWVLEEDAFWSLKKKCGLGNVFSHTEMRPLLFCVSDTPKTALIYLKNGPNCCVRFNFGGRYIWFAFLIVQTVLRLSLSAIDFQQN